MTKRPSAIASNEVFVRASSYNYPEGGFDSTGPIGNDPRFNYRIIGLGRMGESQIDFQKEQRALIAPSFTYAPTSDTKLTLQLIRTILHPRLRPSAGQGYRAAQPKWTAAQPLAG